MPPAASVTDVQLVATHIDGVVIVVREEGTDKKLLNRTVDLLEKVDSRILGCIYLAESKLNYTDYYYYS